MQKKILFPGNLLQVAHPVSEKGLAPDLLEPERKIEPFRIGILDIHQEPDPFISFGERLVPHGSE